MEYIIPFLVALIRFFTLLFAVYNTMEYGVLLVGATRYKAKTEDARKEFEVIANRTMTAASFGWALFVMMVMYKGQ